MNPRSGAKLQKNNLITFNLKTSDQIFKELEELAAPFYEKEKEIEEKLQALERIESVGKDQYSSTQLNLTKKRNYKFHNETSLPGVRLVKKTNKKKHQKNLSMQDIFGMDEEADYIKSNINIF